MPGGPASHLRRPINSSAHLMPWMKPIAPFAGARDIRPRFRKPGPVYPSYGVRGPIGTYPDPVLPDIVSRTVLRGVSRLQPGHCLAVEDDVVRTGSYWAPPRPGNEIVH